MELMFRAFDTRTNIMLATDFHIMGEVTCFNVIEQGVSLHLFGKSVLERLSDVVITQYTGLKDNEDQMIYEGDILAGFTPSIPYYEVFYDRYSFRLRYPINGGSLYDWGPLYRLEEISQEENSKVHLKIIGNRFQNPELLKSL